jgi:hypothetical protein
MGLATPHERPQRPSPSGQKEELGWGRSRPRVRVKNPPRPIPAMFATFAIFATFAKFAKFAKFTPAPPTAA